MTSSGRRSLVIKGLILMVGLLIAEFALPNYVSRFALRLSDDLGLSRGKAAVARTVVIPEDSVPTNEFAFRFFPVPGTDTERAAGVLGPNASGGFDVVNQTSTEVLGRDLTGLLKTMNAAYPDEIGGGIKQLIDIDGALFGVLGLQRGSCVFGALVDLERMATIDEYPCIDDSDNQLSFHVIGGGYDIEGDRLLLAIGNVIDVTWGDAARVAQDLQSPYGKILQYDIQRGEGTPRLSNRRIFTSGHRNPQGMMRLGENLLAVEHGPQGGDEINLIIEGRNYGWPLYTAGSQYNHGDVDSFAPAGSGLTNPMFTFIPSIATSDISECPRVIAERYDTADCAIVSGLAAQGIFIVLGDFANERVWSVEKVPVGARVREVFLHDDTMFLVTDFAQVLRVEIIAYPCKDILHPCGREH